MNDFSHLKNKLLAEQIEDQIYHYILDTPIEPGIAAMAARNATEEDIERLRRLCERFDMFPNSEHIETVCALSKLDVYQKITVDLKMDELDVTAAETKATYEEIREYVKEHADLNVSNLYIAQVKRKCGIKERQNYNKPKAENPKQLKCPREKEKAIREALKYFKMI